MSKEEWFLVLFEDQDGELSPPLPVHSLPTFLVLAAPPGRRFHPERFGATDGMAQEIRFKRSDECLPAGNVLATVYKQIVDS
jgi:hypothetical protein